MKAKHMYSFAHTTIGPASYLPVCCLQFAKMLVTPHCPILMPLLPVWKSFLKLYPSSPVGANHSLMTLFSRDMYNSMSRRR